jgi:hypothetical protein
MPPIGALEIARYHISLYIQGAAAGGADPGNQGRGWPTMDTAEYMHDSIGLTREQARFDPFAGAEGRGAKRAVPSARRGGFMAQGSAGAGARCKPPRYDEGRREEACRDKSREQYRHRCHYTDIGLALATLNDPYSSSWASSVL